jgi:hypothetical protein
LPLDDWRVEQDLSVRDIDQHLYTWTPRLLRNLLTEAGFAVEDVRVVVSAWPPHFKQFARLPPAAFDWICRVVAVLMRRRQLAAIARKLA